MPSSQHKGDEDPESALLQQSVHGYEASDASTSRESSQTSRRGCQHATTRKGRRDVPEPDDKGNNADEQQQQHEPSAAHGVDDKDEQAEQESQENQEEEEEEEDEDERECRICRTSGPDEQGEPLLENVCACRGSLRFVHSACIIAWVNTSGKEFTCEICGAEYHHSTGAKWTWTDVRRITIHTVVASLFSAILCVLTVLCVIYLCIPVSKDMFGSEGFTIQNISLFCLWWSCAYSLAGAFFTSLWIWVLDARRRVWRPSTWGRIHPAAAALSVDTTIDEAQAEDTPLNDV